MFLCQLQSDVMSRMNVDDFFPGKLPRLRGFFANVMRGRVLSLHNIH